MNYQTPTAQRHKQFTTRARTRRNWILAGLAALAILIVAGVLLLRHPAKPAPPPSIPVNVAKAAAIDLPVSITALGAAQAWTSVTVLAQVSGKLLTVDFKEGTDVKKGQLLAQIDPALYLAVLTEVQGTLTRDRALLANARLDLERYQSLQAANAIAGQTVDTQRALVQQDEGIVKTDEGAVAAAQVNVGWTRIVAPTDGRVGVRLVDPGNLVRASDPGSIATLTRTQPIAVMFTLPARSLDDVRDAMGRGEVQITAFDQDNRRALSTGKLLLIDNQIDQTTATIRLKAMFENQDERLWPGEFINARLLVETRMAALAIPSSAVQRGPQGLFAWVVNPQNVAQTRKIEVGPAAGDQTIVASGLADGERVVTDGQYKLQQDVPVTITAPAPAPAGSTS
jgi:multidrug efflux system membrane fusion protein